MDAELSINHHPTSEEEQSELQKHWDAIAKYYDTDDWSDLDKAIENTKISENPAKEVPPAASAKPINPTEQPPAEESQPAKEEVEDLETAKRRDELTQKEVVKSILENKRTDLAKLYVKNRRLIPGHQNKIDFAAARNAYEVYLDTYLKAEARITYDDRKKALDQGLQTQLNALNASDEDFETKKQALDEAYANNCKELKSEVNSQFLENFLEEQKALEAETIEQINGGNTFRKIVHAFRSNKYIKGALIAAGVAGLAVTGIGLAGGLAAGTVSVGFAGFTTKAAIIGAVKGAARGATTGFLGSRQDASTSAINNFSADRSEELSQKLTELGDITEQNVNTRGVVNWIMNEYDKANTADRKDNRKRTLIATGLGATLGALTSGIKITKTDVALDNTPHMGQTTTETVKITNFDNVNIAEGRGAYDTFTQMGGDPDKLQQALDIMHDIDSKYGLVPGDSGATGSFAHTYPGPISSWPDAAQTYITEVAKEWAKQELIPSEIVTTTTSGPIYGPFITATETYVPTGFIHYLTGAAAGTVVGDIGGTTPKNQPANSAPDVQPVTSTKSPESWGSINDNAADEIEKQIAERKKREEQERQEKEAKAKREAAKKAAEEAAAQKAAAEAEAKIAEREKQRAERAQHDASANTIEAQIAARESNAT